MNVNKSKKDFLNFENVQVVNATREEPLFETFTKEAVRAMQEPQQS